MNLPGEVYPQNHPEIACEMGIIPLLENTSNAIIRPNTSREERACIQVIKRMAMKRLPRPSKN